MKRKLALFLALSLSCATLPSLVSCRGNETVLRIASWEEYIDEGGDDSYIEGSNSMIEDFEKWYEEKYDEKIRVVYIPFPTTSKCMLKSTNSIGITTFFARRNICL